MNEENITHTGLADTVAAEVLASGRAILGELAEDASADGMLTMIADVSRGAVMAGKPELLENLRDVLPWIATYHKVTASRAALGALVTVAGSVVRVGLLGFSGLINGAE